MTSFLFSALAFLIALGPLVIFHEFGHYIFARIFNVKAEIFSIGFGPKLWSRQLGETELRLSAVPLGGYVKLLGEDREATMTAAEAKRALHRQVPWKRFLIFFGGPLFNFIMAIGLFAMILVIGEPQIANVIGRVVRDSPAQKAGLVSGDTVLSINGKDTPRFDDIMNIVSENPGKPVRFVVRHPGSAKPVELTLTPSSEEGFSIYGEETQVGEIDGMMASGRGPQIGISDPRSAAGKDGIKTDDTILSVNGTRLNDWESLEASYAAAAPGTHFHFQIQHAGAVPDQPGPTYDAELVKSAGKTGMAEDWGLRSSELFVEKAIEGSPALKSGVREGDRLIGVDGHHVNSFFELKDEVQEAGEKEGRVNLAWERDGHVMSASIVPTATNVKSPTLKSTTEYTVGVVPKLAPAEPVTVIERTWNPFKLLYKATERMVILSYRNFVSIRKMITGDVSVKTLGGPILIGKIAGESLAHGWISFLTTMAILSIGLGVLNILPIPVLDGGHLMLLAIEAVRRKPLTMRQMEIIQGVGLSLLLLLMVVVFRNDFMRLDPSSFGSGGLFGKQ